MVAGVDEKWIKILDASRFKNKRTQSNADDITKEMQAPTRKSRKTGR